MIYYAITFAISIWMAGLYGKKQEKKYLVLAVLPIILLSGFRFDVGTDYMFRYYPDFKSIQAGKIPYNLEIGYLAIVKICMMFSNNFQVIVLTTSVFIYGLLMLQMFKYSSSIELSLLVFILGGFYFDSLNIVRQYMAIMLLIFCMYEIVKGRLKSSVLYLILATLLHNSALIFVIIYIPCILKYSYKNIFKVLALGLVSVTLFKPIMEVLASGTRFIVYFKGELSYYTQGDLQTILCVKNIFILSVYIYIIYKNKHLLDDKLVLMYTYCQSVAVILNIFTGFMFIAFRFTYMFSVFQVFSVPYMLKMLDNGKRKCVTRIVLITYLICLCYLVFVAEANEVIPYQMKLYVN